MRPEFFLWTRTNQVDYNFLVWPRRLDDQNRQVVKHLYHTIASALETQEMRRLAPSVCSAYCFALGSDFCFMRVRRSPSRGYLDHSEAYWEAAGVFVDRKDERAFKALASALWRSDVLWRVSEQHLREPRSAAEADLLLTEVAEAPDTSSDTSLDNDVLSLALELWQEKAATNQVLLMPFSEEGQTLLQRIVRTPGTPLLTFAFGILESQVPALEGMAQIVGTPTTDGLRALTYDSRSSQAQVVTRQVPYDEGEPDVLRRRRIPGSDTDPGSKSMVGSLLEKAAIAYLSKRRRNDD